MAHNSSFARIKRRLNAHFPRNRRLGLFFVALFFLIIYVSLPKGDLQSLKNYFLWICYDPFRFKNLLIGLICFVLLICLLQIKDIVSNAQKYIRNSSGYFTLKSGNSYHHRHIASRYLGRKMVAGEEVHHLNGKTRDNRPGNLCVLMHDDHKAFHRWLSAERKRLGYKYPPMAEQRRMLRDRFNGILL